MGLTASPWQLTYPDPGDRPSVAADELYFLADRMDYHLTNWQADDARLRRRPAAKLTYDSTVKYKLNSQALYIVYYNNVQCDTGGMTDLQRRADRIYLPRTPRPAIYTVGGSITGLAGATDLSSTVIRLSTNALWSIQSTVHYPYVTRDYGQNGTDTVRGETFTVSSQVLAYQAVGAAFDDEIWVQLEIQPDLSISVDFNVWYADLWAYWSTDVAAIPST